MKNLLEAHVKVPFLVIALLLMVPMFLLLAISGENHLDLNNKQKTTETVMVYPKDSASDGAMETTESQAEEVPVVEEVKKEGVLSVNESNVSNWQDTEEYKKSVETKIKYLISHIWNDKYASIYEYPNNSKIYYYAVTNGDGRVIKSLDVNKIKNFLTEDSIFLPDYEVDILKENFIKKDNDEYEEYRLAGLDGSKLVFVSIGASFSPGPCFSNWEVEDFSDSELFYVDLSQNGAKSKMKYNISKEKLSEVESYKKECITNLDL